MGDQYPELGGNWLAVSGFALLFLLTVILFLTPPASGYEISIYDAYPIYFWVIGCLALLVGNVVIVRSAYDETSDWVYGLLLVLCVVGLITLLSYFRGYTLLGRADVLTHVGFITDIQKTNGVTSGNIYPNIHLLVLSLAFATGLEPMTMLTSVGAIASVFGITSILALLMVTFGRRRALLSIPFATVVIGVQSAPFLMSSLLVPFVLYLFVKERQTKALHVRAALATVLFSMVLYHPITTVFLLLVFATYSVARFLTRRNILPTSSSEIDDPVGSMPLSQLMIAVFAIWYLDFEKIIVRIEIVLQNTLGPVGGSSAPIDTYSSTVNQYSPALLDLVQIFTLRYGAAAILLVLAGLYSLLLALAILSGRAEVSRFESMFVGGLALFSGAAAVFLVVDLLVGFGRPLVYATLFGALLAGGLFISLSRNESLRPFVNGALYVTLAVLIVVSTFGLYAAPAQIETNQQVTENEFDGSTWYLEHRDDDVALSEFGIETYRFRDAIYGRNTYTADQVVTSDTTRIPPHFNYTEHETLGASYERDQYMILTTRGRIFYQEVYPDYRQFWSFQPSDFQRLPQDETVSHVYSNGGYDVYRVNATG